MIRVSRPARGFRIVHGSSRARGTGAHVVTIGNFDGVHVGHQALLSTARARADALGSVVAALTFEPLPRDVMAPDHGVPRIQTRDDRVRWLSAHGADRVVLERFSRVFAAREASWFVEEVLLARLGAVAVVVGWDFRFGRGREGDAGLIAQYVPVVDCVEPVIIAGGPASSTRVRRAVLEGDLDAATALLGRPHELAGPVVHGEARGRTIGFPTANVAVETELMPPHGVYAVRAEVGGQWLPGVANLGTRPTVGAGRAPLEVHLFDGNWDLYDKPLRVALVARLREERRFDSLAALSAQIAADVVDARAVLAEGAG